VSVDQVCFCFGYGSLSAAFKTAITCQSIRFVSASATQDFSQQEQDQCRVSRSGLFLLRLPQPDKPYTLPKMVSVDQVCFCFGYRISSTGCNICPRCQSIRFVSASATSSSSLRRATLARVSVDQVCFCFGYYYDEKYDYYSRSCQSIRFVSASAT